MKRNRRILSLLLAICLAAALIPTVSAAQDIIPAEYAQDDQVVNYAGNDWILLDSNAKEIVLLLQTPEAPIAYNASGLSNAWAGSNAKAWCDGFAAKYGIAYEVTFLSHEEVVTYWANNSAANLKTENGWWLRYTEGLDVGGELFGIAVSDAGFVGFPHVATNYGARPVVKIPVSDIAAMVLEDTKWTVKVIDEGAYSGFAANMNFDAGSKKVTVAHTGAVENSTVYVVVYDQLGKIVSTMSQEANGNAVELTLSEELVGRYTVRIFNSVGDTASAVIEEKFAIEDDLGNVTEWNINLGGNISANFNLVLDKLVEDDPNAKVAVTVNGSKTETVIDELPVDTTTGGTACRVVSVSVCAPQMSDEISIQVIGSNGAGGEQKFSIRQYAKAIIDGNFSDSTKDLVKHMLNYGAKAQTYFDYNTSNLATDGILVPADLTFVDVPAVSDDHKPSVTAVDGFELYGTSLVLNSNTTLRFYFKYSGDAPIEEYDFKYDLGDLDVYERTVGTQEMYFADIKEIAPDELNKPQTVSINGKVFVSHNPISYVIRMYHNENAAAGMHDLMDALYNYHTVAANYSN